MNWKKRYEAIKKGDSVKLIKYGCGGRHTSCCHYNKYFLGDTYKVTKTQLDEKGVWLGQCYFNSTCIEKV